MKKRKEYNEDNETKKKWVENNEEHFYDVTGHTVCLAKPGRGHFQLRYCRTNYAQG